jgi:hypothetical protein
MSCALFHCLPDFRVYIGVIQDLHGWISFMRLAEQAVTPTAPTEALHPPPRSVRPGEQAVTPTAAVGAFHPSP